MDTKVNHTIVGGFVIVFTTLLIIIGMWLSAGLSQKNYQHYLVFMDESVSGLSVKAPVKYNGVDVGYVQEIKLRPHNPHQVQILLAVEAGTPITMSTRATLDTQGLTGVAFMELTTGDVSTKPLKPSPSEPYPVIMTKPSLLVRVNTVLTQLSGSLEQVSRAFETLLDDDNTMAISNTIQNIENITAVFDKNSQGMADLVRFAAKAFKNIAAVSKQLPAVVENVNDSTESFKNLTQHLKKTSSEANETLNAGQVALENISSQTLPQASNVMSAIQELSQQMQQLADDLTHNPSMLIRGKEAPELGPGE